MDPGGQQFRLSIAGVPKLVPPLAACAVSGENPIHGPHRRQVPSLVEKSGVNFPHRTVSESLAVKDGPDLLPLRCGQGPGNMLGQPRSAERLDWSSIPVIAGTRNAEVTAGFAKTN